MKKYTLKNMIKNMKYHLCQFYFAYSEKLSFFLN